MMGIETVSDTLTTSQKLLLSIIEKSDSVTILFSIVILIGIIVGGIPIIKLFQSHKKSQSNYSLEERKLYMSSIKDNTNVLESVKNNQNIAMMTTNLQLQNIEKSTAKINEKIQELTTAVNIIDSNHKKLYNSIVSIKEKSDIHINAMDTSQKSIKRKLEKLDDTLGDEIPKIINKLNSIDK